MASTPRPSSSVASWIRRDTVVRASTSRPESISSSTAYFGLSAPIIRASFRFFSPPERSTLTGRARNRSSKPMRVASATRTSLTPSVLRPAARADSVTTDSKLTPGTSVGCWRARNSPARARSHVGRPRRSTPSRVTDPSVTSYPGRPIRTWDRVDLPEPLGPITAWTSPGRTSRSIPWRISVSPTRADSPSIRNTRSLTARAPGPARPGRHHRQSRPNGQLPA